MPGVKTECEVAGYEETDKCKVILKSHWNRRDMVTIDLRGEEITVVGRDLKDAVDNCMNGRTV